MKDATIVTLFLSSCLTLIAVVHDAELLYPIVIILAAGMGVGSSIASYRAEYDHTREKLVRLDAEAVIVEERESDVENRSP